MSTQHDSHNEYRFGIIEKRLDKLDQVHEIVTRLDERLEKFDAVYDNRISNVEEVQKTQGKDVEDLKTFKWKAVGTIGLALVIVSIFGSAIGNAIVKKVTASESSQQGNKNNISSITNFSDLYQAKDAIKGSSQLMQPIPTIKTP